MARANLGTILYFAGRFDEAETELRRALQIAGAPDAAWGNPNDPSSAAGIGLAKVLIAQRRYDEAFTLIQSWPRGSYATVASRRSTTPAGKTARRMPR